MRRLLFVVALCAVLAGCSDNKSADSSKTKTVTIAVNAPFSQTPYVGQTIADGAALAAAKAAVDANGVKYRFRIKRYDTGLSPSTAVRNVRKAIADGAVAIVDEGTGVDASWQIARDKDIPLAVTYEGGEGLIDPAKRPNVFRIAPTDHGMSYRFAEYLIPKKLKIALITDDSSYGQEGAKALDEAFSQNPGLGGNQDHRPELPRRISRRRCFVLDVRARPRSSSGRSRRRLRACSRRRARPAGRSRCTRRRPARTRSCASSSRTIRTGSTA